MSKTVNKFIAYLHKEGENEFSPVNRQFLGTKTAQPTERSSPYTSRQRMMNSENQGFYIRGTDPECRCHMFDFVSVDFQQRALMDVTTRSYETWNKGFGSSTPKV